MRILSRHNVNIGLEEVRSLLEHQLSPKGRDLVGQFERAFATYHGVQHAVATGTGRVALFMALRALELPAGASIAIPAYAFYTLPAVVEALGYRPVFVPVNRRTFAVDPDLLEKNLPADAAALLLIQPFGQAAPMETIQEICTKRGLFLIEDPSQSIGARYREQPVGTFGAASVFSLVPGKNMTACGGGMLLTDDDEIARVARDIQARLPVPAGAWRNVFSTGMQWALSTRAGFALGLYPPFLVLNNLDRSRLDALFEEPAIPFDPDQSMAGLSDIQAVIGLKQLARLDGLNAQRRRNAYALIGALKGLPGIELPEVVPDCTPTFNAVAVRIPSAARFRQQLLNRGIDSREDYMRWYDGGPPKRDEILYLPNHPGLTLEDMAYVAGAVRELVRRGAPG